MAFSPFEMQRDGDSADRAGFDIMLAVASARQAASPTARLSLQLEGRADKGSARDLRLALLAGRRVPFTGAVAGPGCFAALDVREAAEK